MKETLIGITIIGGIIIILYSIKRQFSKLLETQKKLDAEKKYILRTKAKIKIFDDETMMALSQNVIIYFFDQYFVALSPDTYENSCALNIIFFKTEPNVNKKMFTTQSKILTANFIDKKLSLTANAIEFGFLRLKNEICEYQIIFEQLNDNAEIQIRNFNYVTTIV